MTLYLFSGFIHRNLASVVECSYIRLVNIRLFSSSIVIVEDLRAITDNSRLLRRRRRYCYRVFFSHFLIIILSDRFNLKRIF